MEPQSIASWSWLCTGIALVMELGKENRLCSRASAGVGLGGFSDLYFLKACLDFRGKLTVMESLGFRGLKPWSELQTR